MKKLVLFTLVMAGGFALAEHDAAAEARKEIALPRPAQSGGMPLMTALSKRQTLRSFAPKALSDQALSNLLWAACGVNRPGSDRRTAPSAMNNQEVAVYAALPEGLYLYHAKKHRLELVLAKDLRALTGEQGFVKKAPLNLVFVADLSKTAGSGREEKLLYSAADTGFISQNVYLFCASEGLATVVRGYVDKKALAKAMGLKSNQMIILAQTVGHPAK